MPPIAVSRPHLESTHTLRKPALLSVTFASMKLLMMVFSLLAISFSATCQPFLEQQYGYARVAGAFRNKEDSLKMRFNKLGLQWPPKQVYIRSFKYDSELEVWVRNTNKEGFKLFKTYKVCALSGTLGPKRVEGDYQVPEGFYYINEFKPNSNYHLALGINYPNQSDLLLSDSAKPGTDIYIHGNCVTTGCIPVQNEQVEELYILATYAKSYGMDFIPVHIFPVRYNIAKSVEYFLKVSNNDKPYQKFAITLKDAFDYFENNKKLPIICINKKGEYVVF